MKHLIFVGCIVMTGCGAKIQKSSDAHPADPSAASSSVQQVSALPAQDFPTQLRIAGGEREHDHNHGGHEKGAAEPSAPRPDPADAHEGHGGHQ